LEIDIITLFPSMFDSPFSESIIKRAQEKGLLKINIHNLRSFTNDKHHTVDDRPYGGGTGMVLKPEPIYRAVGSIKRNSKNKNIKVILLSPQGKVLNQTTAKRLVKQKHIILICGHYEGIDERVMKLVHEEISIGDYVLTGGEIPAMVLVDVLARLIPGVVKEKDSVVYDSFYTGFLDYPHYTRPRLYKKMKVPEILLSGNHKEISLWRRKEILKNTYLKRPDLLKYVKLTNEEKKFLETLKRKKN